ncbi:PREDICTED: epidermal growth factor receptor-like [Branchiostoma belcheri]|uniref:Epidermal growth factor receptor-like n=1 Tax=Branchiostoma belcheri TaxID=7741 RepID=A0A6P4XQS3_BRABE|nr:PREDICTED: epidermal growth factor receptor-like [Branchiostoma belcheri]
MAVNSNKTFLVLVICLLLSESILGTVQLFATVPENAGAGETVLSVLSAIGETRESDGRNFRGEEVLCKIVDGNKNGRFRATAGCVLQVARPLDYSVDPSYNLTVNVTVNVTVTVQVQVQDVEGYPPVYNDTCEMPIRRGESRSGDLIFDVRWQAEAVVRPGGVMFFDQYEFFDRSTAYGHSSTATNDCTAWLVWDVGHAVQIRQFMDVWDSNLRCFKCFHTQHDTATFQVGIINRHRGKSACTFLDHLGVSRTQSNVHFRVAYLLKLVSARGHYFTCSLPGDVSVTTVVGAMMAEVSHPFANVHVQPVGCPPKKYGLLCDQNCTCENGARCHGLNGACKCQPGWQGVVCDIPHNTVAITATSSDSERIYITGSLVLNCKAFHLTAAKMIWTFPNKTEKWLQGTVEDRVRIESIQPEHNGTYTCTAVTEDGRVVRASFELQAVECPPGKTGELCAEPCDCPRGASCHRWAGCVCPVGWTGPRCRTPCPGGTYGEDCSSECRCQNQATCAPTDGRCNCSAGWFGPDCSVPCPAGLYGWRCRYDCGCKNNATCHHVDGSCTCVPSWSGQLCDVKTDENTFPFLLQIVIPLTLTLLISIALVVTLFTRNRANNQIGVNHEEEMALLELQNIEEDMAESLQPGWLNKWEKKVKDLRMGELIGLGAFAQIRKGHLCTDGAKVAVAVKSVRGEDRQFYRAFCREVASLIVVHQEGGGHANIVRLFGVITKSTPKCILLEYAAKGDLSVILKQQPGQDGGFPLADLLRYAVHISCALKELRRLRIAHGDVAARNVLVSGDDVAKLADFGLAHDVYTANAYVSADRRGVDELLPLKWMSLESLETRKFTCDSDTWSFGVLLWEIAAFGEEPNYEQEIQLSCPKLVGLLRQGVRLQKPPGCTDRLYDVMASCWREEPSARPEPIELEQKLTECRHELDPLLVVELETLV